MTMVDRFYDFSLKSIDDHFFYSKKSPIRNLLEQQQKTLGVIVLLQMCGSGIGLV